MTATPTFLDIRQHIESDLDASSIQALIDDAEQEVIARYGEHSAQVDYLEGGSKFLFPTRPVSLVTSIVETVADTDTTLATNDYDVKANGWMIKRRQDGSHARLWWAPEVTITYTPVDDDDRRKRVIVDLVRLAIQYTALNSERVGDYSSAAPEYQQERERILRTLLSRRRTYA